MEEKSLILSTTRRSKDLRCTGMTLTELSIVLGTVIFGVSDSDSVRFKVQVYCPASETVKGLNEMVDPLAVILPAPDVAITDPFNLQMTATVVVAGKLRT